MRNAAYIIVVIAALLCGAAAAVFLYDRWQDHVIAEERRSNEVKRLIAESLQNSCNETFGPAFSYNFEVSKCCRRDPTLCIELRN